MEVVPLFARFAILGVALSVSAPAQADESPYRLAWKLDGPLLGFSVAGIALGLATDASPRCTIPCRPPESMNALDRTVLGNYSPAAHSAANVTVLGLAALALTLESTGRPDIARVSTDLAVTAEAVLLAQGITQTMKTIVGRPAPFTYRTSEIAPADRESRDAFRSFISGHTATSFCLATAITTTFWLRHPKSDARFVVLGVTHAAALLVGLLKIEAGYHFPTDVAAGALVGSSVGLLVPMIHRF